MTRKRTYTFPNQIIDAIELEADKRIQEQNLIGKRLTGAVARDIICLLTIYKLSEIKKMPLDEYKSEVKRIKNRRAA